MDFFTAARELTAGRIRPVYLLHGEDAYQREQFVKLLAKTVVGESGQDFNYSVYDAKELTFAQLQSLAETLPFGGARRLIVVHSSERLFDSAELAAYVPKLPGYTCLVLVMTGKPDARKKLYQTVEKTGLVVDLSPLKGEALQRWIARQLADLGKKIERQAVQELLTLLGDDAFGLARIANELEKLALYSGERPVITREDVVTMLARTPEHSMFRLIDAVGEKRAGTAMGLWSDLRLSGEEPQRVLVLLARQVRLIWQAKEFAVRGYAVQQIAAKLGVAPFVAQRVLAQGKRFTPGELSRALEHIYTADLAVKTGKMDPYTAMELLLGKLCC